MQTSTAQSPVF